MDGRGNVRNCHELCHNRFLFEKKKDCFPKHDNQFHLYLYSAEQFVCIVSEWTGRELHEIGRIHIHTQTYCSSREGELRSILIMNEYYLLYVVTLTASVV
jgi:hypothetical protein